MKHIFTVLSLLAVAGCSTYSKQDCEVKDWYQEGFASAREGLTESHINHFRKNCSDEHGVPVDPARFTEGYQKGLTYFCTEQHGRNFGREGKVYQGTCPKETEEKFLKNYESGRLDFLVQRVNALENEVSDLQGRNAALQGEVSTLRGQTCN